MNTRTAVPALILSLYCAVFASAEDETREPPQRYYLEVDGKRHAIVEGEPLKLTGAAADPTVKLVVDPHRQFSYGGMSVLYPRHFSFEAKIEGGFKQWTLSGNDAKVMLFETTSEMAADGYAKGLMDQFGRKNCKSSPITLDLFGEKRTGIRVKVTLAQHTMHMDVFTMPGDKGSRVVFFQDNPTDAGEPSTEGAATLELLKKAKIQKPKAE